MLRRYVLCSQNTFIPDIASITDIAVIKAYRDIGWDLQSQSVQVAIAAEDRRSQGRIAK